MKAEQVSAKFFVNVRVVGVWEDTWEDMWEEDGKPLRFQTEQEAEDEIRAHMSCLESMGEKPARSDFLISAL